MAIGESTMGLLFRIRAKNESKDEFREVKGDMREVSTASAGMGSSFAALAIPAAIATAAVAAIGVAVVATTTALWNITKAASDFGSEINDAAEKSGLSVRSISALKFAADQSGASLTEVASAMSKFSRALAEAGLGATDAKEKLIRLGLDPQQAHKDLEGSLAAVIKRIYEIQDPVAKGKLAIDAFGRSGRDLIPLINTTKGDFEAFTKAADKLGVVMSEEAVRAADEFGDALDLLKAQASGVGLMFAKEFMPDITRAMGDISKSLSENKAAIREWGRETSDVLRGLKTIAQELYEFSQTDAGAALSWLLFGHFKGWYGAVRGIGQANRMPTPATRDQIEGRTTTRRTDGKDAWEIQQDEAEAQKKAADERKKAREKYLNGLKTANKLEIDAEKEKFEQIQKDWDEALANRTTTLEEYQSNTLKNLDGFNQNIANLLARQFQLDSAGKSGQDLKNIQTEYRNNLTKLYNEIEAQKRSVEKKVTETEKKESDDRLKIAETEANRKIELEKSAADITLATLDELLQNEIISQTEYAEKVGKIKLDLLEFEKKEIQALEQTEETKHKLALLDLQITKQGIENSQKRAAAIQAETDALIAWNKEYDARATAERPRYAGGDRGQPPKQTASDPDSSGGVLSGILSHETVGLAGQITAAFSQMADAVGAAISAFVKFGSVGGSFRKFAAEMIASIASMAAVQAVWELAQGFAKLALAFFGHPTAGASATMHFTAAAVYGTIAAVAAVAGRAVAGNAFRQQTQAATGQTGANAQGSRASGGAYSGQKDMTYEQSRNAPSGIGGAIVVRDKTSGGMFDQLFEFAWDRNGKMRQRLQAEFGT